ncbi:MAG: hypothetical protein KDA44_09540 [Planctomycetales bacterium]|nr:hypothetical protein [Planctomycetales bacterium]
MSAHSPANLLAAPSVVDGFTRMPLAAFWAAHRPPASLYLPGPSGEPPKLLCKRGYELRDEHLQELSSRGMRALYVANSELAEVSAALLDALDAIAENARVEPHERVAIVQLAEAPAFDVTLRLIHCGKAVAAAQRIGQRLADLLIGESVDAPALFASLQHDDRASIRATNGAVYGLVLAKRLGLVDADNAAEFAVGALLRDLGERLIPPQIVNKPTRLTPADRTLLESHPTRGYAELRQSSDLTQAQLMIVYQHHEHVDGGGYPVAIIEQEIHPWAQAIAVADAFEGLTGRRAWRDALDVPTALAQLIAGADRQFNREMVACWQQALMTSPR